MLKLTRVFGIDSSSQKVLKNLRILFCKCSLWGQAEILVQNSTFQKKKR